MNAREIAKFIKDAVKTLSTTDSDATYHLRLDKDFAIYVGWGGGFDAKDDGYEIHSKSQPTYCICVKIAEYNPSCPLWDNVCMPWDDDGEVWDTDSSISPNEDYNKTAVYLNKEYREMRKALKEGKITF